MCLISIQCHAAGKLYSRIQTHENGQHADNNDWEGMSVASYVVSPAEAAWLLQCTNLISLASLPGPSPLRGLSRPVVQSVIFSSDISQRPSLLLSP